MDQTTKLLELFSWIVLSSFVAIALSIWAIGAYQGITYYLGEPCPAIRNLEWRIGLVAIGFSIWKIYILLRR